MVSSRSPVYRRATSSKSTLHSIFHTSRHFRAADEPTAHVCGLWEKDTVPVGNRCRHKRPVLKPQTERGGAQILVAQLVTTSQDNNSASKDKPFWRTLHMLKALTSVWPRRSNNATVLGKKAQRHSVSWFLWLHRAEESKCEWVSRLPVTLLAVALHISSLNAKHMLICGWESRE